MAALKNEPRGPLSSSDWVSKYGKLHKPTRILEFPMGIEGPKKVRIYARNQHFLLQFWDPALKKNLNQRVDGDLLEAIVRAREIDQRLLNLKSSGLTPLINHQDLAQKYLEDLEVRCRAGEIDVKTVGRYHSAIQLHYLEFCELPAQRRYSNVHQVNRDFQMAFAAYLADKLVSPNGHPSATKKFMSAKGQSYVLDCVKAMYQWATDKQRGNLLPNGFENPFLHRYRKSSKQTTEQIRPLDITLPMACDLISRCDLFQLQIFSHLIMFGLRPSELSWTFWEDIDASWHAHRCHEDLDYYSKGRQNKRFPIIEVIERLQRSMLTYHADRKGLVFLNRKALKAKTDKSTPSTNWSLNQLAKQFQLKAGEFAKLSSQQRRKARDRMMREHGQLSYDQIKREFYQLANELEWPTKATLKDLRHLFSTGLENAGVPTYYRKYLMGQKFGKAPIVAYTHITQEKLEEHFLRAVESEFAPIVEAIDRRLDQLV